MSSIRCLGKKSYASETAARSVISALRARNQDCDRLRPVKCELCHAWHLAKQAPGFVADDSPFGGSAA